MAKLIKELFGIVPAIYTYNAARSQNVVGVTATGVAIVEFLVQTGLTKGDKVKHQIGVPAWIKNNLVFAKGCLRGLIDTDGCVFQHKHFVYGLPQYNTGIFFSNHSLPLLNFVYETLSKLGFSPKYQGKRGVCLYREREVVPYAQEVGFNNSHRTLQLQRYLKMKAQFVK